MFDTILWIAVLIIMVIVEATTVSLVSIWFAGGALVALITGFFEVSFGWQVVVFFVISFVLLFFTRPLALSFFNKEREKTNIDSIIGSRAIVQKEINNLKSEGVASLNGQQWTARAMGEDIIPAGEVVVVKKIQGVKLIVEKVQEE